MEKSKKLVCGVCLGYRCKGDEVKAKAQFKGSSQVLDVSVQCADKVIDWNDRH